MNRCVTAREAINNTGVSEVVRLHQLDQESNTERKDGASSPAKNSRSSFPQNKARGTRKESTSPGHLAKFTARLDTSEMSRCFTRRPVIDD